MYSRISLPFLKATTGNSRGGSPPHTALRQFLPVPFSRRTPEREDGWLDSQNVSRAQDRELASSLANDLFLDRTLEHDAELEALIAALSVDQINAAMRNHIDLSKISVVKAGDFAGEKEEELVP